MEMNFKIAAKIDKRGRVEDYPLGITLNPEDNTKFALGHSSGNIHLMDLNALENYLIINNEQVLNDVKYDVVDNNLLWFGTRKSLNCVDLRLQTKVLEIPKIKNEFLSFDVSQAKLASIGTELFQDSPLLFYDLRKASAPIQEFHVHSDDITQVKFNPADPNCMMTGSTDGLFCLYDLSTGLDEDEALYQCIKDDSVQKIGWFGPEREYVYSLTHIETLSLYTWDDAEKIRLFGDVRGSTPELDLDYCIDLKFDFNSQFLFLAAGSRSGNIGILNVNLDGCSVVFTLNGGHSEGIVRDVNWNIDTGILISASEDGNLVIWKN